jgi:hypothetical protein
VRSSFYFAPGRFHYRFFFQKKHKHTNLLDELQGRNPNYHTKTMKVLFFLFYINFGDETQKNRLQ